MLACGCRANAKRDDGTPSCVIHCCAEIVPTPDLAGRTAKCASCKNTRPSSMDLAFFEYQGPGSPSALDTCKCGYYRVAHEYNENRINKEPIRCRVGGFAPVGPRDDKFYCGCQGWD